MTDPILSNSLWKDQNIENRNVLLKQKKNTALKYKNELEKKKKAEKSIEFDQKLISCAK